MPGSFVVLIYHRVGDMTVDPHGLTVSPTEFTGQMDILCDECEVMPFAELVSRHSRGETMQRSAAVTFDDGYLDNLEVASPILLRAGVPATFFLTAEQLEDERYEYWWDTIARGLLDSGAVPEVMTVTIQDQVRQWELGTHSQRTMACTEICRLLTGLDGNRRRETVQQIVDCLSMDTELAPVRRMHTTEIKDLSTRRGHDIGAHTMTHPRLSIESKEVQQKEIADSRAVLRRLTGQAVSSFAYPFGDVTQETVALVRKAGFQAAAACDPVAFGQIAPWTMPRAEPRRRTGAEFRQWLASEMETFA